MSNLSDAEIDLFPLTDIESVANLIKTHIERNNEPNLAILSIIIGFIENTLTCFRGQQNVEIEETEDSCNEPGSLNTRIPIIEYEDVDTLYQRFLAIVKTHIDVTAFGSPKYATRELVKRVSDVVWCTLSSSYYKDRAHLQSIYSYMTGAKLDSSGTTLAVVASLQVLGYYDVHLALSEDHTWIVCGENGEITVEVTWHGKGNEDKRGIPVTEEVFLKSWLYVNGQPVICTRHMEVATIVSSMNPGINTTTDSEEVILLQQVLLWLLYDAGHLSKYPMAIDNLGDLEEMNSTLGRPPATKLYEEAILSNIRYYRNQHVYPYTYLGGYFYRNRKYRLALKTWAMAANVIENYNHSRDDEEIYKEFLEIATELMPHIIRTVTSSDIPADIFADPFCFAHILQFYDGICGWEENSPTPVLHIGWAKALLTSIMKFEGAVRSHVVIQCVDSNLSGETDVGKQHCKEILRLNIDDEIATISQDQNGNTSVPCNEKSERAPSIKLHSAKMMGMKDLLLAEKLNAQAISLQLTAQSQVTSKRRTGGNIEFLEHSGGRSKRTRREIIT